MFAALRPMVLILSLCGIVAACAARPPVQTTEVKLSPSQITAVESGIKKALKDPYSAQFGPIVAAADDRGVIHVCGTVNAKNSFGGYVGYKPFLGFLNKSQIIGDVFTPELMATNDSLIIDIVRGRCYNYRLYLGA